MNVDMFESSARGTAPVARAEQARPITYREHVTPPSAPTGSPARVPEANQATATSVLVTINAGEMESKPAVELEEFFEFFIESVNDAEATIRTVSSGGEEGVATLPFASIPDTERKYAVVGAPGRVSVLVRTVDGSRRRSADVRMLRPSQWQTSPSEAQVTWLQERFAALLTDE